MRFLIVLLLVLRAACPLPAQELPRRILIQDDSFNEWSGRYNYRYELLAGPTAYRLYRTRLEENRKRRHWRKRLPDVPTATIRRLVAEIDHPRPELTLEDLGYQTAGVLRRDLAREFFAERLPQWNAPQRALVEAELHKPENLARAVRRSILGEDYALLHSSSHTTFTLTLLFATHQTTLTAAPHYLGLPWHDAWGRLYHNVGLAAVLREVLPPSQSFNRARFEPVDVLPLLVAQLYADACAAGVAALAWAHYPAEFARLRARYQLDHIEQTGSGDWQWNFEDRIEFEARDSTMPRGLHLLTSLTIDQGRLYPVDSVLARGAACVRRVQQVPFLLRYLAEDPTRVIRVGFNNDQPLSPKVRQELSVAESWRRATCLAGASAAYLRRYVYLRIDDDHSGGSTWLLTPENDVILVWYFGPGAWHYTTGQLGLPAGAALTHACKHFDPEGHLQP